eukprot:TRINITY_DN6326_c0_g1_i1.p1 TRINITY_DN6326_c0_g1~~TRINITY_DN6326_c0_g1_i1.p1  ORF type:complete len:373 (-),score=84.60 TRINITY_DN6326_c0_g1_i1:1095-2213(-)
MEPLPRKRVHFLQTDADDEAPRPKRARFPKGRKDEAGKPPEKRVLEVEGEEDGPILHTNPRAAAKERAMRRTLMAEELRNGEEDADDLAAAEEDYQGGQILEDDGIAIEPFNLKQEREEGFFDAEGNYVEYRNHNELKDAWLDSVEVNTRSKATSARLANQEQAESFKELSLQEIRAVKRRIADVLQPGETVLNALRRIKGSPKDGQRRMPESTKVVFDQLTEDAMKLVDDGDIDVYSQTKEMFVAGTGMYATSSELSGRGSMDMDMFGEATEAHESSDMFGDDDGPIETPAAATFSYNVGQNGSTAEGAEVQTASSGYILDESTGYYYNSEVGYYYDPKSGLFCNAVSGIWFRYDDATNSYTEVSTHESTE